MNYLNVSEDEALTSARIIVSVVVMILAATTVTVICCCHHKQKRRRAEKSSTGHVVVSYDSEQGRPWVDVEWPGCSAKNLLRMSVTHQGWAAPLGFDAQREKMNVNCSNA